MKELLKQLIAIDSTKSEIELAISIEQYLREKFSDRLFYTKQFIQESDRYNLIV